MQYKYIATQTSATVAGATRLHSVVVGTAAASAVVSIYNGAANSAEVVAVIDASAAKYVDFDGITLGNGMFVEQTGGSAKVTVTYA